MRTMPQLGLHLEVGTNGLGALVHDTQAQMIRSDSFRIESSAIVPDFQLHSTPVTCKRRSAAQAHFGMTGTGVLCHVVQSLLGDAVEGNMHVRGHETIP